MTYANYSSGWCGSCGRKRGKDGRCANCDPWWSSPLVTYGAPLFVGMTLLLIVGTNMARNNQNGGNLGPRTVQMPQTASRTYAPIKGGYSPGGFGVAPVSAYGASASAPAPMRGSFGGAISVLNITPADANRPSLEQVRVAQHEQLRQTTAYVDQVLRTDDISREYAARNDYLSSTRDIRPGVATMATGQAAAF